MGSGDCFLDPLARLEDDAETPSDLAVTVFAVADFGDAEEFFADLADAFNVPVAALDLEAGDFDFAAGDFFPDFGADLLLIRR